MLKLVCYDPLTQWCSTSLSAYTEDSVVSSCLFIGVSLSDVLEHEFWAYSTPITSQGSIHLPFSPRIVFNMFLSSTSEPWACQLPTFLEWVFQGTGCVVSLPFPVCVLPLILNCSSTGLIHRQGGAGVAGQSLHLGFPYLEKRTWLNCQILRPERQQPHHVQVSMCLPHRHCLPSGPPPRISWSFRALCQPNRGSSSAQASEPCSLYRTKLVENLSVWLVI